MQVNEKRSIQRKNLSRNDSLEIPAKHAKGRQKQEDSGVRVASHTVTEKSPSQRSAPLRYGVVLRVFSVFSVFSGFSGHFCCIVTARMRPPLLSLQRKDRTVQRLTAQSSPMPQSQFVAYVESKHP